MGIFDPPCRIDTPQPINKQFVTGDYIGDVYTAAPNWMYIRQRRLSGQMGEIYNHFTARRSYASAPTTAGQNRNRKYNRNI